MKTQVRRSGSTLVDAIRKIGPGMREQGELMQRMGPPMIPTVLCEDGYFMLRYRDLPYDTPYTAVAEALEKLWFGKSELPVTTWRAYLANLPHVGELSDLRLHLQDLAPSLELCQRLSGWTHGDATTENMVMTADDRVALIDPSLRLAPTVAEMDLSKLYLACHGYGPRLALHGDTRMLTWIHTRGHSTKVLQILALTHVLRIWGHQEGARPMLYALADVWKRAIR